MDRFGCRRTCVRPGGARSISPTRAGFPTRKIRRRPIQTYISCCEPAAHSVRFWFTAQTDFGSQQNVSCCEPCRFFGGAFGSSCRMCDERAGEGERNRGRYPRSFFEPCHVVCAAPFRSSGGAFGSPCRTCGAGRGVCVGGGVAASRRRRKLLGLGRVRAVLGTTRAERSDSAADFRRCLVAPPNLYG